MDCLFSIGDRASFTERFGQMVNGVSHGLGFFKNSFALECVS